MIDSLTAVIVYSKKESVIMNNSIAVKLAIAILQIIATLLTFLL